MKPCVSVIVPVFRNADTVRELHARLCRTLERERITFELLFVDDACPAGSLPVLLQIAQADPRVAVLSLEHNVGQHRAVLAGLAHARGEWSVIMDADLQDPPESVPTLIATGQAGFAAVFGGRRGRYESPARLATSRLFKWVLHVLTGVPADAGIFCAINRPLAERVLSMPGRKPFVVAMIGCAGLPMASIPVERAARPAGRSAYSSWGRLKSAWRGVAWALRWKLRTMLRRPSPQAQPAPIRARYGMRFASDAAE